MIPNQHCVVVAGVTTAQGANADDGRRDVMRTLGAGIFLALAALLPAQQAAAQDPLAGAIVGGALGGIVGGALGRGGGAIAGAVIGAITGAVIAAEAQQRSTSYYWWRGGCYYRYPNGSWLQVQPGYCSY
jgi:outer membrane lipoprotein SlyB